MNVQISKAFQIISSWTNWVIDQFVSRFKAWKARDNSWRYLTNNIIDSCIHNNYFVHAIKLIENRNQQISSEFFLDFFHKEFAVQLPE